MIPVGAVNIDTSHPMGFGDSMKKDGRVKVEGFIARYGLERRL